MYYYSHDLERSWLFYYLMMEVQNMESNELLGAMQEGDEIKKYTPTFPLSACFLCPYAYNYRHCPMLTLQGIENLFNQVILYWRKLYERYL